MSFHITHEHILWHNLSTSFKIFDLLIYMYIDMFWLNQEETFEHLQYIPLQWDSPLLLQARATFFFFFYIEAFSTFLWVDHKYFIFFSAILVIGNFMFKFVFFILSSKDCLRYLTTTHWSYVLCTMKIAKRLIHVHQALSANIFWPFP